ncbi:MAG: hypothetical protein HY422_01225 [Candidatus Komeilibacteria bacterium]|nr:hypothetical protein [Candidatus Komeilibacteria bacterium]
MPLQRTVSFPGTGALFYVSLIAALTLSYPALPASVRVVCGMVYLVAMSFALGKRYASYASAPLSYAIGLVLLGSYYAIAGSAVFYFASLTHITLGVLTVGSTLCIARSHKHDRMQVSFVTLRPVILFSLITVAFFTLLAIFAYSRTDDSFVTPWVLVPSVVFFLMFCIVVACQVYALRSRSVQWLPYILLFLGFFGVLIALFPLGFGFDPLIHETTEKILLQTGTLSPKPLYYVGYYSLAVWSQLFLGIPISIANGFLSSVLLAALIPVIIATTMRYTSMSKSLAAVSVTPFLLLPLSDLTQSTPLALSLIWAIIVIQLSIVYLTVSVPSWTVLFFMSVASAAFHPLIGLPLCVYVLFAGVYSHHTSALYRKILMPLLALTATVSVPIALLIAGRVSDELTVHLRFKGVDALVDLAAFSLIRFVHFDDLLYTIGRIIPILLILLAVIAYTKTPLRQRSWHVPVAFFSLALLISYILTSLLLNFNFATTSEQSTFPVRLYTLFFVFLFPLSASGYHYMIASLRDRTFTLIATLLTMAALVTISWYLLYPRFDTQSQYKGYSPSRYDYTATQWIHEDARDTPYVVLANQTVSAVALKQYGFFQYHNGVLYYPLPTNGRLYPEFLSMTANPENALQTVKNVRDMTGVQLVYLIVNAYWSNSKELNEKLPAQASKSFSFGGGAVTVYRFE